VHDGASAVRTPGDVRRTGNRAQDYTLTDDPRWRTTARLVGARSISASSSRSDSTAVGGSRPGELPLAAIDGDSSTQWVSDAVAGEAWWQVRLPQSRTLHAVGITLGDVGPDRTTLRVTTAAGSAAPVTVPRGGTRRIMLRPGRSDWLRVQADAGVQLSLAEVAIPGVSVSRQLVLPTLPSGWSAPDVVALRALRDARTGCVRVDGRTPCLAERARPSEEPAGFTRVITMPTAERYVGSLSVLARPGAALDDLLQEGRLASVRASSTGVPDPRASGLAALDGSPGTAWTAAADDPHPALEVSWLGSRTIRSVTVAVAPAAPVRRPTEVLVGWAGGTERVRLDRTGRGELSRPVVTDHLSVEVTASENAVWADDQGGWHPLPVGVSRLRLGGLTQRALTMSDQQRTWPCGSGPQIRVGGRTVTSRLVASPADLYAMRPVTALPCGEVELEAGENVVSVLPAPTVTPTALLLRDSGTTATAVRDAPLRRTGPTTRVIDPPAGAVVVDQRENANAGWTAEQGGRTARSVVLDGWRQGWLTDPHAGAVHVRFAPDGRYRVGLGIGLVLLLALWLLALRRSRAGEHLPSCTEASLPAPVVLGLGLAGLGLLAGWAGLGLGVVGVLLGHVARRTGGDQPAWAMVVVGPLAAGAAYALRPWGTIEAWAGQWAWPHYLVVVALGVALALASPANGSWRSLMKGRSTRRWSSSAAGSVSSSVSPRITTKWPPKSG
jgi:arabinofuranan 3-O-arabinosyltransferase